MNQEKQTKILILTAIAVTLVAVFLLFPEASHEFITVVSSMNPQIIAEYLRSFGLWAVAVSLFLNILQTLVAFMPSVFLSGANAVVFGLFWGGIISWSGEVIGAAISFVFYRYLGRHKAAELIQQPHPQLARFGIDLSRLDQWASHKGFTAVLIARLAPFVPSGLVNLLAALSAINFTSFIAATALGKAPSLILETFIGHDLIFFSENKGRLALFLGLVVLLYIGITLWSKKQTRSKKS
ncbi:MAG: TVP38/TMEM64 family protein [Clostridia bacterium]|nr:TVP38/TMEM64 family protein [Clostridia bacterium]